MDVNIKKHYNDSSEVAIQLNNLKLVLGVSSNTKIFEHLVKNYLNLLNNYPVITEQKNPYKVWYNDGTTSILEMTNNEVDSEQIYQKVRGENFYNEPLKIVKILPYKKSG